MNKSFHISVKAPKERNVIAMAAWSRGGAGGHKNAKRYNRKEKHRGRRDW